MRRASVLLAAALLTGCASRSFPVSPEMSDVLAEWRAMHPVEPSDTNLQRARDVPSLVEAAFAIGNVEGRPAEFVTVGRTDEVMGSGAAGPIGATLVRPALAKNTPVIIYFPGGTWATRRDADDVTVARQLSARTGFIVVVPRLRLAPQARFPDIHDDALAAYQWARGAMRSWGGDPTRVVLAGSGPGANLALSTALTARERNMLLPDALLLITPWASASTATASMGAYALSQPLSRDTVRWAHYLYAPRKGDDPRLDLMRRSDWAGLPPTLMILAEIDPLRSAAETVAAQMRAAGDWVDVRLYPGVTYDFFGLGAYVPRAADAEADAASALLARFGASPPAPSP